MADPNETRRRYSGTRAVILAAVAAALVTLGVVALLVNIFERKQEGRNPFYRVVELTDDTEDPAVWGKNFPQQYDGYRRTVTARRGSEAEDPVGRLRVRDGLSRRARPCLHARGSDIHRASAGDET